MRMYDTGEMDHERISTRYKKKTPAPKLLPITLLLPWLVSVEVWFTSALRISKVTLRAALVMMPACLRSTYNASSTRSPDTVTEPVAVKALALRAALSTLALTLALGLSLPLTTLLYGCTATS